MSTVNIDLAAGTILNVMIGQQDENEVREVVFDFSDWYTTYGSGTITLAIQRSKDEWPYEADLTVDSGTHKATWEISDTDTAYAGTGQIQLSYKVGDAVKKSVVYRFTCHRSLGALGNVVTPVQIQTFIDEVEAELLEMDGKLDSMEDEITSVKQDLQDIIDSGTGMSEDFKQALHDILENVAYIDEDGQDYLDALDSAMWPPADLVSISAVYTQSGTVYDTDTLDSLKSDLVVTAHMSDSTTQTVTTYTLSGTLVVGTSTITVSYGGKTTTFNVNVSVAAPLYSFENGTHTFSNNTSVTVENGNEVTLIQQSTNGNDTHANVTSVTSNSNTSNSTNNYLSNETFFVIPANSSIHTELEILEVENTNSTNSFNIPSRITGTTTSAGIAWLTANVNLNSLTVGEVFERDFTVSESKDVGSIGLYCAHNGSTYVKLRIRYKLWVNDVRYL